MQSLPTQALAAGDSESLPEEIVVLAATVAASIGVTSETVMVTESSQS